MTHGAVTANTGGLAGSSLPAGASRAARNARRHGLSVCEANPAEIRAFVARILLPSLPRAIVHHPEARATLDAYARAHLRVEAVDRALSRHLRDLGPRPVITAGTLDDQRRLLRYRGDAASRRRAALRAVLLLLDAVRSEGR